MRNKTIYRGTPLVGVFEHEFHIMYGVDELRQEARERREARTSHHASYQDAAAGVPAEDCNFSHPVGHSAVGGGAARDGGSDDVGESGCAADAVAVGEAAAAGNGEMIAAAAVDADDAAGEADAEGGAENVVALPVASTRCNSSARRRIDGRSSYSRFFSEKVLSSSNRTSTICECEERSSQLYTVASDPTPCCERLCDYTQKLTGYKFNDPPCTPCSYNIVKERPTTQKLET